MIRAGLDRYRHPAGKMHGGGGGNHGVRADDHFVARREPTRKQSQLQPVGGIRHTNRVGCTGVLGYLCLKCLEVPLQYESASTANIPEDLDETGFVLEKNLRIRKERNLSTCHGNRHSSS